MMAGFAPAKMKRKDLEEVSDDFSDFSLSAPARKIRRLDAELPPIIEEEEPGVPSSFGQQQLPGGQRSCTISEVGSEMSDAMTALPVNEERAVVLYKPVDSLALSPSSFKVNLKLINGLKNQVFWPGNPGQATAEEAAMDDQAATSDNSLAMVPWVPSQSPLTSQEIVCTESRGSAMEEPMEAEEAGTAMEVEEDREQAGSSGVGVEGFHQWQQQHCMYPQIPQNTSTQIMWSWG